MNTATSYRIQSTYLRDDSGVFPYLRAVLLAGRITVVALDTMTWWWRWSRPIWVAEGPPKGSKKQQAKIPNRRNMKAKRQRRKKLIFNGFGFTISPVPSRWDPVLGAEGTCEGGVMNLCRWIVWGYETSFTIRRNHPIRIREDGVIWLWLWVSSEMLF